jgi:hypothetical protein
LPAPADDRSTEVLRYECSNDLGRRDLTLFANGTVRLRQGLWQSQEMTLDELTPEELSSYLRELEKISSRLAADESLPAEIVGGGWVEKCEIRLALPGAEVWSHAFSPYEIPPLAVVNLIHVAEDLAGFTRPLAPPQRLPADYRPQLGDVLRTAEGERFEVVRFTLDRRGVELEGLDAPVQIFVALDDLDEAFAGLGAADETPGGRTPGGRRASVWTPPVWTPPEGRTPAGRTPGSRTPDGQLVRGMTVDDDAAEDDEQDPGGR